MQKVKILPLFLPAFAAACLAAGFALCGRWFALLLVGLWLLAWWLSRKISNPWMAPLLLEVGVCLAGLGVLAGAPFFLMILSAAAALAGWDLSFTEAAPGGPAQMQPGARLWNRRVQTLATAITLGVASAGIGAVVRLQVPFALMLLLVVLAFASLDRVMGALKNR